MSILLAADIGGTNTRLGFFEVESGRPQSIASGVFPTLEYGDLPSIVSAFAARHSMASVPIDAACFGVAGPVVDGAARLTNVPWRVDAAAVARTFGIRRVSLLNDLQAMAHAVPVLEASELRVLREGAPRAAGNIALIAAGTGLGEAILHQMNGRFVPVASEGGHADFAATNEREIALVRDLLQRFGHAEIEQVVSGMGLMNLHRITHTGGCTQSAGDDPAKITTAALERRCPGCAAALDMFVDAYGREAGNLALRATATRGVFVGGGIAPKILPALADGRFLRAFSDKASPFRELLEAIPVKVIMNNEAGLLGAAVHAAAMLGG